jgi:hypothetical protein
MNKLVVLIARDAAIDKAEYKLRVRKRNLEKNLQDHKGEIAVVDGVIYQVTDVDRPRIIRIGELPA